MNPNKLKARKKVLLVLLEEARGFDKAKSCVDEINKINLKLEFYETRRKLTEAKRAALEMEMQGVDRIPNNPRW